MGGLLSDTLTPLINALSGTADYLNPNMPKTGGSGGTGIISTSDIINESFYGSEYGHYNVMDSLKRQSSMYDLQVGGTLGTLIHELQILHDRIETLTRRIQRIEIGLRDPNDPSDIWDGRTLYDSIGPTNPNTIPEVPGTPKAEEPHPAQNSSFVLKI